VAVPPSATGALGCTLSVVGKLGPGLTVAGRTGPVKIHISATISGCTGVVTSPAGTQVVPATGAGVGSVAGLTTDPLTFGPGAATGSFAAASATLSPATDIPGSGGVCPTSPAFSAFTSRGSLSL